MATAAVSYPTPRETALQAPLAPGSLLPNVIDLPTPEQRVEQTSLQRLGMVACENTGIVNLRSASNPEQSPYYDQKLLRKYNQVVHSEGIRRRALLAEKAAGMERYVTDGDFATWYQQHNSHGFPLNLDVLNRMGNIDDARDILDALVWLSKKDDPYDRRMAEIAATNELEMATNPLVRWALDREQAMELSPEDADERNRILRIHALLRPNSAKKYGIEPRHDQYMHVAVRESSETQHIVDETRLVYAEGYSREHDFLTKDAIDPVTGFVIDNIDHSRTEETTYHLAYNPADPGKKATMRIISVPAGGSIKDLPSYKLCEDALFPEERDRLAKLPASGLRDISAMAKTEACNDDGRPDGTPLYEIIRKAVHEAISQDPETEQEWFFAIVSRTRKMLMYVLTPENLQQVGEEITINDPRVTKGLLLTPARLRPNDFIDNIRRGYETALRTLVLDDQKSERSRKITTLRKSFLFYTEGLPPEKMSPESIALRRRLLLSEEAA